MATRRKPDGKLFPIFIELEREEYEALRWKTYDKDMSNVALITELLQPIVEEWKQLTGKPTDAPQV